MVELDSQYLGARISQYHPKARAFPVVSESRLVFSILDSSVVTSGPAFPLIAHLGDIEGCWYFCWLCLILKVEGWVLEPKLYEKWIFTSRTALQLISTV